MSPSALSEISIFHGRPYLLALVARHENKLPKGFSFTVIPWMLACICLLDGIVMAVWASPMWLLPGLAGMSLTRLGQKYIRGD
jgi:hypothetical protein